jgi:tRNA modification GTPase
MARPADTIAALATPAGTSALAVIRISGPDTARLAREILGAAPPPRSARPGHYHDRAGAAVDEALFTFFAGPHSYTGEDALEISCHGNPFIAHKVLEDLFARGCRPAEPGEFTRRAFLNGKMDLSQAEAVMDVIHARGERALIAAQRLLDGALGRQLRSLTDELLGILARVEAYIDFPDEDLPPEDRGAVLTALRSLQQGSGRLLATRRSGELLRHGISTVIVGEPNVGKSSILNLLVGRDRAIVSPEPGTTRDFIEEPVIVGPHCIRLTDTAGLNPAPGTVESLGIEKTWERIRESDLLLLVLDATHPSPPLAIGSRETIASQNTLVVINKIDLLGGSPVIDPPSGVLSGLPFVALSARTGAGFENLADAIVRKADALLPAGGEDGVFINARHAHALENARHCLAEAAEKLESSGPIELLASDLRGALDAFGDIAGKIDNERMLDRLFAEFCIGK